jgi:hypothetical protein
LRYEQVEGFEEENTVGRTYSSKEKLGALVYDVPRFCWAFRSRKGWMQMRNRADRVMQGPDRKGIACDWEYTRTLHICDVFPITASWLMRRALSDWPIAQKDRPDRVNDVRCCSNSATRLDEHHAPEVSFLIGHRGVERWPLLQEALRSIAAQQDVCFEVVIVEQDVEPVIRDHLPDWVRYIHTPCQPDRPYCRSWAFNVAAREARAPLLVLHDNDMLVPARYAAESHRLSQAGWEVISLKRFIFYVAEMRHTQPLTNEGIGRVESVLQNAKGGGSLAIRAATYEEIGGFDEDFVGWGGEDNEFWDRCMTRKVWAYGYLPIVHLWHPPQPGKRAADGMGSSTADLARQRRAIPPEERILNLKRQRTSAIES